VVVAVGVAAAVVDVVEAVVWLLLLLLPLWFEAGAREVVVLAAGSAGVEFGLAEVAFSCEEQWGVQ